MRGQSESQGLTEGKQEANFVLGCQGRRQSERQRPSEKERVKERSSSRLCRGEGTCHINPETTRP